MTDVPTPTTEGYEMGSALGRMMRAARDNGDSTYDCRWDLADAAKIGTDYFNEFERGLNEALAADAPGAS